MNLPAVIWALIFFFLPFERFIKIPGTEITWNGVHIFFWIAIIFLYGHHWRSGSKKIAGIKATGLLTVVLLFIFLVGHATVESSQRIVALLAVIWAAPLLALFIKENRKLASNLVVMILAFHSLWAITQFSLQADLNLHLLGETDIAIGQPGIATFTDSGGSKVARAYGPFVHPNVLAGSLVIGLIVMLAQRYQEKKIKIVPLIVWYCLSLGVLLTFSRAAGLGYTLLFFVARNTPTKAVRITLVIITLLLFSPLLIDRSADPQDAALTERLSGAHYARALLRQQQFGLGGGPGNYEHMLEQYLQAINISYEPWHLAPVHNVPLLLAVEWGLLPLMLLAALGFWAYAKKFRTTWPYLLPLIPLLAFDHYLVSQTAPLLFLVVALLVLAAREELPPIQKCPTVSLPTRDPKL